MNPEIRALCNDRECNLRLNRWLLEVLPYWLFQEEERYESSRWWTRFFERIGLFAGPEDRVLDRYQVMRMVLHCSYCTHDVLPRPLAE